MVASSGRPARYTEDEGGAGARGWLASRYRCRSEVEKSSVKGLSGLASDPPLFEMLKWVEMFTRITLPNRRQPFRWLRAVCPNRATKPSKLSGSWAHKV